MNRILRSFSRDEFSRAVAAGLLICIACGLYLKYPNPLGALLFSLALFFILSLSLALFTGQAAWTWNWWVLFGNLTGTLLGALIMTAANPDFAVMADELCAAKTLIPPLQAFFRAAGCGMLMYCAVKSWRLGKWIGVFLAIPGFILAGFEHSIADMGYFLMAGRVTLDSMIMIALVVLGNFAGAYGLRLLCEQKPAKKGEKPE